MHGWQQFVLGLAWPIVAEGFPLAYEVLSGNVTDKRTPYGHDPGRDSQTLPAAQMAGAGCRSRPQEGSRAARSSSGSA